MLLLVNYRPEYQHKWSQKTYYTQLRVDPLGQESAEELLSSLLGTDPGLGPLKELLLRQTERNPFFLEESVRAIVEDRALAGSRGGYRLVRPLEIVRVPRTVQAVLAARIDRLSAEEKRLLQTASVIGKDIPLPILQSIAELPEEMLRERLGNLQAAEFVYEAHLFPDPEYTFKHALTHDVAYANLLQEQRSALHARIVEAIEAAYPGRLEEHVEQLAHHALRGELWERAVAYLRQAAEKAAARSALRAAVNFFEQALDALTRMPHKRESTELAIDLRFRLRTVLAPLGDFKHMLERLQEAESLARGIGDEDRLGWVSSYLTQYYAVSGDPERGAEHGNRAMSIAESLGDFALLVASRFFAGAAFSALGDYAAAQRLLTQNIEAITPQQEKEHFHIAGPAAGWTRNTLLWCVAETGNFAQGLARGKEAVRIGLEANHSYALAGAYYGLGYLEIRRGELDTAAAWLGQGMELCRVRELPWQLSQIAAALAYVYAAAGRFDEARELLVRYADDRTAAFAPVSMTWIGEVSLLVGAFVEATAQAKLALDGSRNEKSKGREAWALHLMGDIEVAKPDGDPVASERAYRDSLALALAHGMRPLQAHCHFGLGQLFARTSDKTKAREHLCTAIAMMREMEMGVWLQQAEAALVEATG
jgi:predicted ATPase